MPAVRIKVRDTRSGIRNAHTRMPFRFGVVTLRAAPVMTLAVEVEDERGRRATGYAGDFLAFRWFDKRPEKTLADNCADLIRTVETAAGLYRDTALEGFLSPFELWRATQPAIEEAALADGFNRLGASFGSSMLERGVIDAVGRLTGQTFDRMVKHNALGIDLGATFTELRGRDLNEFLPAEPLRRLHLRHTVGLVDPITAADRPPGEEAVDDGLPETLEDYLTEDGVSYLKIKVAGDLDADLARLTAIADLLGRFERRFVITLDGNEQYKRLDGFLALMEGLKSRPALRALYDQILFVEQPLERSVAMDPAMKPALEALNRDKPVIIDEADGWVTAFAEAVELGYRGTSHKNCKGVYKSLHNVALAGVRNERLGKPELFLSAEDLTNLPVVPLQADLCVVATLGIDHVERNGHHYFRGLGHLTETEKTDALAHHADLYTYRDHEVYLRILDGDIDIVSLQTPGMGFAALPDMDAMTPPEAWDFASLGQE